jgi:hypothetical protein
MSLARRFANSSCQQLRWHGVGVSGLSAAVMGAAANMMCPAAHKVVRRILVNSPAYLHCRVLQSGLREALCCEVACASLCLQGVLGTHYEHKVIWEVVDIRTSTGLELA